ncbi:MAG: phosphotransferase [Candidatus Azotimanducaceae bacterium WSBS_2022_MAG_OTU7]
MMPIPQIDADYLSQALGSLVESFQIESIGSGEGYMSDLYRITLQGDALPGSVILKRPSEDADKLALATRFNSYGREQYFYRELSDHSAIRSPRCYYNADHEFLLLLEDAGLWPVINVAAGADLDQSITAVSHLARLHASYWASAPEAVAHFSAGFKAAALDMSSFGHDRLAELPQSRPVQFMQRYASQSISYLPLFTAQQQVFSHMDFRLDNLRINGDELILFDWGESSLAPPGFDLAYFLTTSLTTRNRRAWEQALLDTYHQNLVANGIHYTQDELFNSYRLAVPPGFYLAALVLTRGYQDYGMTLAERCLGAIDDHLPFYDETF